MQRFVQVCNGSVIEAPFALFQKQIKVLFWEAFVRAKLTLRLVPEVLNSSDMVPVLTNQFRVGWCGRVWTLTHPAHHRSWKPPPMRVIHLPVEHPIKLVFIQQVEWQLWATIGEVAMGSSFNPRQTHKVENQTWNLDASVQSVFNNDDIRLIYRAFSRNLSRGGYLWVGKTVCQELIEEVSSLGPRQSQSMTLCQ